MNYKKIYNNLISKSKRKNRNKKSGQYFEEHHIIPRSWGGSDDTENLVLLTGKEHWIAHLLLSKFAEGKNKYSSHQAVVNMGRIISPEKRATSKLYEKARMSIAKEVSKRHTGTLIVKDKNTGILIGRVPKDHEKVLSGEWEFFHKGMVRNTKKNKNHSKAMSGKNNPKYSGVSDKEILEKAYEYFLNFDCLPIRGWQNYSKEKYNYPASYTNFRFNVWGGGKKGFKNAMIKEYNLVEENFKYIRTKEHSENIKKSIELAKEK